MVQLGTTLVTRMHADMDNKGDVSATLINIVQCLTPTSILDLRVAQLSPHALLKDLELIIIVIKTNSLILHKPIIHNSWGEYGDGGDRSG